MTHVRYIATSSQDFTHKPQRISFRTRTRIAVLHARPQSCHANSQTSRSARFGRKSLLDADFRSLPYLLQFVRPGAVSSLVIDLLRQNPGIGKVASQHPAPKAQLVTALQEGGRATETRVEVTPGLHYPKIVSGSRRPPIQNVCWQKMHPVLGSSRLG